MAHLHARMAFSTVVETRQHIPVRLWTLKALAGAQRKLRIYLLNMEESSSLVNRSTKRQGRNHLF